MSKQEQAKYKEWLAGLRASYGGKPNALVVEIDEQGGERVIHLAETSVMSDSKKVAAWGVFPSRSAYFSRITGKLFGYDNVFIRPWDDEQAKDYEERKAAALQQWQERESQQREKEESQLLDRVRALDWETLLKSLSYREIGELRHMLNMLEAKL